MRVTVPEGVDVLWNDVKYENNDKYTQINTNDVNMYESYETQTKTII